MYLSYSGFKRFSDCPRAYWHRYINKTKVQVPDNRVGMLYGSILGEVFELFYTKRLWRSSDPKAALLHLVGPVSEKVIERETKDGMGVLDWKDPKLRKGPRSMQEVLESVRDSIPNGLAIIRQHRLLGSNAQAEVKLDSDIKGHRLGGRADFLMRRIQPLGDTIIVDGKGSSHREKYADERQLIWYAMLHRRKFGFLPDRVGFLFWRSEPGQAMDWTTPTKTVVGELEGRVLRTIANIEKLTPQGEKVFLARAKSFNCKFCPYVSVCPEGQSMVFEKPPTSSITGVDTEDNTLDE
jgi:CRISPR/Cas system-associated exonuclease Cas4 (RecB family)